MGYGGTVAVAYSPLPWSREVTMAQNRSILFVDAAGGSSIVLIRTSAGAAAIQAAMLGVMNADWFNEWEGTLNINLAPSPVVAPYQSVSQQAALVFLCADGTTARLNLLAPKLGIFLADGITVDSTMIGGLIAACVGNLLSATLSPATSFLSGILLKRPST